MLLCPEMSNVRPRLATPKILNAAAILCSCAGVGSQTEKDSDFSRKMKTRMKGEDGDMLLIRTVATRRREGRGEEGAMDVRETSHGNRGKLGATLARTAQHSRMKGYILRGRFFMPPCHRFLQMIDLVETHCGESSGVKSS